MHPDNPKTDIFQPGSLDAYLTWSLESMIRHIPRQEAQITRCDQSRARALTLLVLHGDERQSQLVLVEEVHPQDVCGVASKSRRCARQLVGCTEEFTRPDGSQHSSGSEVSVKMSETLGGCCRV